MQIFPPIFLVRSIGVFEMSFNPCVKVCIP